MGRLFNEAVQNLIADQGWNEDTMLIHLNGFLEEKKLQDQFAAYMKEIADEENANPIE